jgi:hypothetical protein
MHADYWIYKNGHQNGPFSLSKIQWMWQAGTITPSDQIRRADQQEWQTVDEVRRYIKSDSEHSGVITAAIMVVVLGVALIWSFVMVWWLYS